MAYFRNRQRDARAKLNGCFVRFCTIVRGIALAGCNGSVGERKRGPEMQAFPELNYRADLIRVALRSTRSNAELLDVAQLCGHWPAFHFKRCQLVQRINVSALKVDIECAVIYEYSEQTDCANDCGGNLEDRVLTPTEN